MKVQVFDGTGNNFLGFGTLVGRVTVYFVIRPDGAITSLANAEEMPPPAFIAECEGELAVVEGNPKIILDNGQVVYGCQVWWQQADVN